MDLKNILNEGSSHTARLSEATRALAGKWEKNWSFRGNRQRNRKSWSCNPFRKPS